MPKRTLSRGLEKYYEFHQMEPSAVDEVGIHIPDRIILAGPAKWITYRSGKWGKGVYDYVHDFGRGVKIGLSDHEGHEIKVPLRIQRYETIVRLGDCMGLGFLDGDGDEVEGKYPNPMPELYCSHDGKALFVIEDRQDIVSIIWGGKLDVEARGIVN